MATNEKAFSFSLFGGFSRKDVLEYIEQTAKAHKQEIGALKEENAALSAQLDNFKKEKTNLESRLSNSEQTIKKDDSALEELKSDNRSLSEKNASLNAELERQIENVCKLEGSVKELRAKCGEHELENFELVASLQKYETYVQDLESAKKLVVDIEMDARRRAGLIETEALENAEMARCVLSTLIRDAQTRFGVVRTDVESTASHVVVELEKIISSFLSINMSFDDMAQKLSKLDVYTEKQDIDAPEDAPSKPEQDGDTGDISVNLGGEYPDGDE